MNSSSAVFEESCNSIATEPTKRRHSVVTNDLQEIVSEPLPWEQFAGKTILVTGANGMIPAYLVETMLFLNEIGLNPPCRVLALVRNHAKAEDRFSHYSSRLDISIFEADLGKEIIIEEPIHYIIHGASPAAGRHFATNPIGVLEANVTGTQNLLDLAFKKKCKKFLFLSSGAVYGPLKETGNASENSAFASLDPTEFLNCYALGKRMGEHFCACWHQQHGVNALSARLGHTYGPGMPLSDGRVFTDFVDCVLNERNIVLNSDGKSIRHFCYLTDATRGLFLLLLRGRGGEVYNLVNTETACRISDLAENLCSWFPEKNLEVNKNISMKKNTSSKQDGFNVDISKITRLGWYSRINIKEGFQRTVRSFL